MIDQDLAQLYGINTRTLKQAVRRNLLRFPSDFMFVLTKEELQFFKVTKCDLKERTAFEVSSLRIHRTGRSNAIFGVE